MTSSKARKLARTLLSENRKNRRSWRQIAREDYGGKVNYATLNRIAKSKGTWLPKDEKILVTLGLTKPRKPKLPPEPVPEWKKKIMRNIARLAKETRMSIFGGMHNE